MRPGVRSAYLRYLFLAESTVRSFHPRHLPILPLKVAKAAPVNRTRLVRATVQSDATFIEIIPAIAPSGGLRFIPEGDIGAYLGR